jgi:hypothetical protein
MQAQATQVVYVTDPGLSPSPSHSLSLLLQAVIPFTINDAQWPMWAHRPIKCKRNDGNSINKNTDHAAQVVYISDPFIAGEVLHQSDVFEKPTFGYDVFRKVGRSWHLTEALDYVDVPHSPRYFSV